MRLRSGKEYNKLFCPKEAQPLKLVLLPNKKKNYDVNIDFDDASKQWRENKIYLGEGIFKYKNQPNLH